MTAPFRTHRDLEVYKNARAAAARMLQLCSKLPKWEFKARDQALSCARSVVANIPEAWRKRRYAAAWVSKLSDSDGEAAEAQSWLDMFLDANYITIEEHSELDKTYDHIQAQLVLMMISPHKWSGQPIKSRP